MIDLQNLQTGDFTKYKQSKQQQVVIVSKPNENQHDNSIEKEFQEKLNIDKKRKPKGTLVNPYIKKRKVQGAKFD